MWFSWKNLNIRFWCFHGKVDRKQPSIIKCHLWPESLKCPRKFRAGLWWGKLFNSMAQHLLLESFPVIIPPCFPPPPLRMLPHSKATSLWKFRSHTEHLLYVLGLAGFLCGLELKEQAWEHTVCTKSQNYWTSSLKSSGNCRLQKLKS